MDNLKKNIKSNEFKLDVEPLPEGIWENVFSGIKKEKPGFKSYLKNLFFQPVSNRRVASDETFANEFPFSRRRNFRLAFALFFSALFIFSCTYRIKRVESFGDLIIFDVKRSDEALLVKLNLFMLDSLRLPFTQVLQNDQVTYCVFVKHNTQNNLDAKHLIASVKGVSLTSVESLNYELDETLMSVLAYKLFKVRVNEKKPNLNSFKDAIQQKLNKEGIQNVRVHIPRNESDVVFVKDEVAKKDSTPTKSAPLRTQEKNKYQRPTSEPKKTEPSNITNQDSPKEASELFWKKEYIITPVTTESELQQMKEDLRVQGFTLMITNTNYRNDSLVTIEGKLNKSNFKVGNFLHFKIIVDNKGEFNYNVEK